MSRYELIEVNYIPGLDWRNKNIQCQHNNCHRRLRTYGYIKDTETNETMIVGATCLKNLTGIIADELKRFFGLYKNAKKKYDSTLASEQELEQRRLDTERFKAELDALHEAFEKQDKFDKFVDFVRNDCGIKVYKTRVVYRFASLLDANIPNLTKEEFAALSQNELESRIEECEKAIPIFKNEHLNTTHNQKDLNWFLIKFGLLDMYKSVWNCKWSCLKRIKELKNSLMGVVDNA